MTKLMEWLLALGTILAIWLSLISGKIESSYIKDHSLLVFYSPVVILLILGIFASIVVLYRTFTFNDCEEAARELQKEIEYAKEDLVRLDYYPPQKTSK